jgi:tetratricopeptide (TPR) repeat protein
MLEVERSTVVRWERGETEPLPWIRPKLAKALRVSADRLEELLRRSTAESGGAAPMVPRQLPAAVSDFTGRGDELDTLTRILDESARAGTPGTVVISAIGGTAGVGKTALALHWAHQVAHRFGDGQLHVNLRGFDPSRTVTTEEAIRGFLDALGVPPARIPSAPDAQAGLYRSLLAGRRMLIVLDNARDEQQVRPLLPASPGSMVVVTSRSQLDGLAATDGARLLSLDVLPHAEAIQLLTARIGERRAAAEAGAVGEIAQLCACLPLALAVAAARAAARPRFPLTTLAAELADTSGRLDALDTGDAGASIRAVFSWSYRQLSPEAARMFRLLGLHPGPDITAPAAVSLAAAPESNVRRLLRELARAHLIAEHAPGRYACHDLLRAYAASQTRACDSQPDRTATTVRLLDHYLHTAYAAALVLDSRRGPLVLSPPSAGTAPEQVTGYQQALAWFEAEHRVLLAAISLADSSGSDVHTWQIVWALADYLMRRGRWHEKATIERIALAAAMRSADPAGEATSRRLLAISYTQTGDYDQARAHLEHCVTLCRQLGDRLGEFRTRQAQGVLAERQGRYADALSYTEQALELCQATGDKAAQAALLNNVGWCQAHLGDYEKARESCRKALALNADCSNRPAEPFIWDTLGYIEHHLGNPAEAAVCYEQALAVHREFGDRFGEADSFAHLGDARRAAGELALAREAWQQALAILDDLDHPDADTVRAKLADTGGRYPDEGEPAAR